MFAFISLVLGLFILALFTALGYIWGRTDEMRKQNEELEREKEAAQRVRDALLNMYERVNAELAAFDKRWIMHEFEEGDVAFDHRGWTYIYRDGDWTHLVDKNTDRALNLYTVETTKSVETCPVTGRKNIAIQATRLDLEGVEVHDGWTQPIYKLTEGEEQTLPYMRQIKRSKEILGVQ